MIGSEIVFSSCLMDLINKWYPMDKTLNRCNKNLKMLWAHTAKR